MKDGRAQEESKSPPPWTVPSYSAVGQDFEMDTGVPLERLEGINRTLLSVPDGFTLHPKLARQLARRDKDFGADFRLAWGHAEALGIGSLLEEGVPGAAYWPGFGTGHLQPAPSRPQRRQNR